MLLSTCSSLTLWTWVVPPSTFFSGCIALSYIGARLFLPPTQVTNLLESVFDPLPVKMKTDDQSLHQKKCFSLCCMLVTLSKVIYASLDMHITCTWLLWASPYIVHQKCSISLSRVWLGGLASQISEQNFRLLLEEIG